MRQCFIVQSVPLSHRIYTPFVVLCSFEKSVQRDVRHPHQVWTLWRTIVHNDQFDILSLQLVIHRECQQDVELKWCTPFRFTRNNRFSLSFTLVLKVEKCSRTYFTITYQRVHYIFSFYNFEHKYFPFIITLYWFLNMFVLWTCIDVIFHRLW